MRASEQRGTTPQSPGIRIVDKRGPASSNKPQQGSKKPVHADFKAKQLLKEKADQIAEKQKTKSQPPAPAPAPKKEAAKGSGMRQQGMYTGKADITGRQINKKEESGTKAVVEAKAPIKAKKEAVLANARKKMGMSEEKRAEFQQRTKEAHAKRMEARNKKAAMRKEAAAG